ncbi:MAG TPA: type II secretion system protein [Candidatus Angelobacter sp.]|nr:type II secretion system protein [Candidatus Angelobacter sp.]
MKELKMTRAKSNAKNQAGYMLLSVMLVMALMLIALSAELPRITQQIKREKEEELVHRGREYAIAIKRYYHKTGTYPASLEQLDSTNNLRFLRRHFKDPMTEKGEFKLIHLGEAQINTSIAPGGANNSQGSSLTTAPGNAAAGSSGLGSNTPNSMGQGGLGSGGLGSGSLGSGGLGSGSSGGGLSTGGLGTGGLGSGTQGTTGGQNTGAPGTSQPSTGQMGTLTTQNIGNGLGGQGGGAIIGVASTSTKTSIKEFNNNKEYDQWLFVYDPRVEQVGGGGVVIAAPTGNTPPNSAIPQPVQPVRTPNNPQ